MLFGQSVFQSVLERLKAEEGEEDERDGHEHELGGKTFVGGIAEFCSRCFRHE